MRIYLDYDRSIRCVLGRYGRGDAEHGCQGGFVPLGRGCARFCLCECHDAEPAPGPAAVGENGHADTETRQGAS